MNIGDKEFHTHGYVKDVAMSLDARSRAEFLEGAKVAQTLSNLINGGSSKELTKGFLAELKCTHRYLQSEVIWLLIGALKGMATENTDARNDFAIDACKKIAEEHTDSKLDIDPRPAIKLEVK